MLIATVLNSTASLNDFDVIGSLSFIPGEETTLVIRLQQPQRDDLLRYIPDSGSTLSINLPRKNDDPLAKSMTALADDRSIWSATLSSSETEELATGNLFFELTESGSVKKGLIENGLQLVITGDC